MSRNFEIYDQAPGFVAATEGPDHVFTYANRSFCRLVGRDNLLGRKVAEALPEIPAQGFVELLNQVFSTGEPFVGMKLPIDLRPEGRVGYRRYVNFVYNPVRDADGAITGLFCEGYDLTAEITATEELQNFQEEVSHAARVNMMGMMAATLAHELNQPLTAVSTYASASLRLVNSGRLEGAVLADALQSIDEAAQRAGAIIRIIRDLTKRGETPKTTFDIKTAIDESVKLVMAGNHEVQEIVEKVPEGLHGFGSRTQIVQVLVNLIRNACESAAPKRPNVVTVSAWAEGDVVIVSVRDRGRGLSSEAARNIFEWTGSDKEGGTGLGLAICRTIVDSHGGSVWLEKTSQAGSVFCFTIPANERL